MKNKIKVLGIAALVAVIGLTVTACGGGGAKKSGLKTDGFFGALPAIFADNNLAEAAARENYDVLKDKMKNVKSIKEAEKLAKELERAEQQWDKKREELEAKLEAAQKAEFAKLNGKDVPYTVSEKFKEFKVNSLKVDETGNLQMSTSDVKKNMMGVTQFKFRALAKDGSVIIDHVNYGSEKVAISGSLRNEPEKWVDFEKIVFVDASEK